MKMKQVSEEGLAHANTYKIIIIIVLLLVFIGEASEGDMVVALLYLERK